MTNDRLEASQTLELFRPRANGGSAAMRGEGHREDAPPIDLDTLGQQIESSNLIEGVEPSGELHLHLGKRGSSAEKSSPAESPFVGVNLPTRPAKASA